MMRLFALFAVALAGTDEPGKKWLADKEQEEGVKVLHEKDGLKLLYKVLNKGTGKESPLVDTECSVHYRGKLPDGTQFDASYDRGEPTDFAPSMVIDGWTIALQEMVEGDKWELYIPSEMAYGDNGAGGVIPGQSPLQFEMELIKIKGDERKARPEL